jgi:2-octaprenylphenol hydroxylase
LGEVIASEKRFHFPLYKQQAKQYVKPHLALVGDAAHTIHPLAGQGVNMGLLDAASLTDVVMESITQRREINLRRYERWRKADNLALMIGVDAIKCLFASDKQAIKQARSFGLHTVNRVQWVKNYFSRHAVGDRDGLPSLAKYCF